MVCSRLHMYIQYRPMLCQNSCTRDTESWRLILTRCSILQLLDIVLYCYTSLLRCVFLCYITLILSLPYLLPRSFAEGVTMYSWLVTVLLLASAAYCSGGQGAVGGCVHWVHWCMLENHRTYVWLLVYSAVTSSFLFPLQVHKCPSQAISVHSLATILLLIVISAVSVVDSGHVKLNMEFILICWMATQYTKESMYGWIILTPLWCWTFPKDGVLVVWRWHF